ncbi:hypothetical protein U1Q18_025073, partial [Sarracenia purpurea var. burkii]
HLLLSVCYCELLFSRHSKGLVGDGTKVFGTREKETSVDGKEEKLRKNWDRWRGGDRWKFNKERGRGGDIGNGKWA